MEKELTPRQRWVLDYLKKDCNGAFISPSNIGSMYGKLVLNKSGLHSSTGSPICKELVELGLVERNSKGHYRAILK